MGRKLGKKNIEGYLDLTPYKALRGVDKALDQEDAKRMDEALKMAKRGSRYIPRQPWGKITIIN